MLFFWINAFPPSKLGSGKSAAKDPWQIILGTAGDYKKVFRLQPGEYFQVHQEYEPQDTINIYRSVRAIILVPQYNLQGGYLFEILLTGKHLQLSNWNPVNMTEDVIEI